MWDLLLLLSLLTVIYCTHADLITVSSPDDFNSQIKGVSKYVMFISCTNLSRCPWADDQITLNCNALPDVKCFKYVSGITQAEIDATCELWQKNSIFNVTHIPYVGFVKDGVLIGALNQKNALQNHKVINAGFRALGGKL